MVQSSEEYNKNTPEPIKVWTFLIVGGESFEMEVAGHPKLIHMGKRTLWKMVGTEEASNRLKNTLEGFFGPQVTKYTESQTEEQIMIRKARLGKLPFTLEVDDE